jgi:hypothetical protein
MANILSVQMSKEHIDRNSAVTPKEAIKELLWNACDADATRISVTLTRNHQFGEAIEEVIVTDNGHGMKFEELENLLGFYGRSNKTYSEKSLSGRRYHGKQGHGRFKSFSIGVFVKWESTYFDEDGKKYRYSVNFDANDKMNCPYSEKVQVSDDTQTGMVVTIAGVMESISPLGDLDKMREEIISSFAAYLLAYSDIEIRYDGFKMNPNDYIQERKDEILYALPEGLSETKTSKVSLILWKSGVGKEYHKLFICGIGGVTYDTINIPNKNNPISAYIMGDIFDELHKQGKLAMGMANPYYESFVSQTKDILREFINSSFFQDAVDEVKGIKESDMYPYTLIENMSPIEMAEREYFDLLAVEINNIIPSFRKSSNETKKLTYRLIKEAVKSNPDSLTSILTEVFKLSEEEQNKMASLLEYTTLPSIIDMTQTISNRLLFIHALEQMVYNLEVSKPIKERTQFHKILLKELWVFGEKYALGASDVSLKNVLVKHLKHLKRDDLIPSIPSEATTDLSKIPDLCLWQQYPVQEERIENLVIELKRPNKVLGKTELDQIKNYAYAVTDDPLFDKTNTKWNFILLGRDFNNFVINELSDRKDGAGNLYNSNDGSVSISVYKWSKVIQENKLRFNFLKERLSYFLEDSKQALDYLHTAYADLFEQQKI